jgi:hypothetical protein
MLAEVAPLQNIPNKEVACKVVSAKELGPGLGRFCTESGSFCCKILQRKGLGRPGRSALRVAGIVSYEHCATVGENDAQKLRGGGMEISGGVRCDPMGSCYPRSQNRDLGTRAELGRATRPAIVE